MSVERSGSSKQAAHRGTEGLPKHVRPSKQAYYERKANIRVYSKLGDLPADQLTVKLARFVEWIKGMVPCLGKSTDTTPKRQKSADRRREVIAKKPKISRHKYLMFSEVVEEGGEVVAIVYRAEEEESIPKEKWRWIKEAIAEVYLKVLSEHHGPPPR